MELQAIQRFTGLVISIDNWRCMNLVPILGQGKRASRTAIGGSMSLRPCMPLFGRL